jgi:hypothetical protein
MIVMLAVVAVMTNIQFLLMDMVAIIITECLYFLCINPLKTSVTVVIPGRLQYCREASV